MSYPSSEGAAHEAMEFDMSFFKRLKNKMSSPVKTRIDAGTEFSMKQGRLPATARFTCTGEEAVKILSVEYELVEVVDSHNRNNDRSDQSRQVVAQGSVQGPWMLEPGAEIEVPFEVELPSATMNDISDQVSGVAGKLLKMAANRSQGGSRYDLKVGPNIEGRRGLRSTGTSLRNTDVQGRGFRVGNR